MNQYLQARRTMVATVILAVGIVVGLLIYVAAPNPSADLLADQANTSKQYVRQMEEYGGSFNLVTETIRQWFAGLWQGKTLGITVACLSALVAAAVYIALTPVAVEK